MSPEDRARLRALCDQATPGPWRWDEDEVLTRDGEIVVAGTEYSACDAQDGEFIAAARTALPALLDEVERLELELAHIRHDEDHPGPFATCPECPRPS